MTAAEKKSIVLAASGASGAIYGRAILRALSTQADLQIQLIVSDAALRVFNQELEARVGSAAEYLEACLADEAARAQIVIHDPRDIGARPASGSSPSMGMIVMPCSMKTLAGIAHGYTANLIERAADVCLKERRRLVLCPREAPYSLIHLRNMTALTEAGAVILPASPGFYQKPKDIEDLARFVAGRALTLFGFPIRLFDAWDPPAQQS